MLLKTIDRLRQRWSGEYATDSPTKPVTPADILTNLYTAWSQAEPGSYSFQDPTHLKTPALADRLPLPPAHLRMGYSVDSDELYLRGGEASAASLRTIMQEYGLALQNGSAMLDWGCATGRVLRWFLPLANEIELWGVDQDELSMVWAKENLNPPFHFVTCSAYPHLPFADNKFGLIYGLSVFTHLAHFRDLWLMEMQRILQHDGYAIFTIHDEHTVQFFIENGRPAWIPADLALPEIANHETTIIQGNLWYETYTFFTGAYIRKEWGRYFQVLGIRPFSDGYQSAVVLRKR
jgi:SAM-dependent methyltransferase